MLAIDLDYREINGLVACNDRHGKFLRWSRAFECAGIRPKDVFATD